MAIVLKRVALLPEIAILPLTRLLGSNTNNATTICK
jgi:hypothetical protein